MKKTKSLLLLSGIGVLALLVGAAISDNFMKEWQTIQGAAVSPDGAVDFKYRQVVNPSLKVTDRCVTCHLGMAPGEQITGVSPVYAPHKPVVHKTSEMGCTTCHGGQGQATEKADAHGNVAFWTEPMLPAKYAYASCGTCHTPLNVPDFSTYTASRQIFERLDCYSCHRLDGRGGTLRPGGSGGMEGPDLSHVGIKGYDNLWYDKHLAKVQQEPVWRSNFKEVSDADRASLETFLSVQMGAPKLIESKAMFNSLGCAGCHAAGGFGGDAGLDLSLSGLKDPNQLNFSNVPGEHTLSNWIAQHFRSPSSTVQGSLMPALRLTEEQIDLLTLYTLSLRRRTLPDTFLPKDRVSAMRFGAREFLSTGAGTYAAACSSCHGATGAGTRFPGLAPNPSITNPDFLEFASDEFLANTIRLGRPGRPMPAWGQRVGALTDPEIAALVQYIRQLGGGVQYRTDTMPAVWAKGDPNFGSQLYSSNCAGCHGKIGEGIEGPALGNKMFLTAATDTYLFETISRGRRGTVMQGFNSPSSVRRQLTREEIEAIIVFIRTLGAK